MKQRNMLPSNARMITNSSLIVLSNVTMDTIWAPDLIGSPVLILMVMILENGKRNNLAALVRKKAKLSVHRYMIAISTN